MEIKLKDFIFCDEVRREIGNKFSIMGIYSDKLRVRHKRGEELHKFRLFISAYMRFELISRNQSNEFDLDLSVKLDEQEFAQIQGRFGFAEDNYLTLPINKIETLIEKPAQLTFNMVLKNTDGITMLEVIKELKIVFEELPEKSNATAEKMN